MPRVQREVKGTQESWPPSAPSWHGRRQALLTEIRALPGVLAVVVMGYRSRRALTKWCTEQIPIAAFGREMLRAYQVQMALQRATSDLVGSLPELIAVHDEQVVVAVPVALAEPAFVAVLFERAASLSPDEATRALRDIVRGPQP